VRLRRHAAGAVLCAVIAFVATASAIAAPENVIPIGQVQGTVTDTADGLTHRSPFAPASGNSAGTTTVTVQGVVTQKVIQRTSSGGTNHGIFLQNTAATADANPNTSDGIFVFMSSFSTILRDPSGSYTPQVGDEIRIRGRVSEFFNLTQLSSQVRLEAVLSTGVAISPFETTPPDDLRAANRYWERHEGELAGVPANSVVTGPRDVFASTADGEVWVIRGDHPLARRADPYARRSFRDPHPLDDVPATWDNGNGYRIILGSHGLKAIAGDNTALIAPARTFDTVTNSLTGGVYFSFAKYQLMVQQQPTLVPGVDPSLNAPPTAFVRQKEWSAAPYNVENLYDFRDDPSDPCDFNSLPSNPGCFGPNPNSSSDDILPPFDYAPASQAEYQRHLEELAHQIALDLKAPDLLLIQEAEDQDLDADGRPDTLQDLALAIRAAGGPDYVAVYDRDGADDRGIVSAFLYRADRVELLAPSAGHPVLGATPTVSYRGAPKPYNSHVQNPKALNAVLPADVDLSTGNDGTDVFTRAPQIGLFRIWRVRVGVGSYFDVYAVSNHFSSTPQARVGQRREQAAYNAAIVNALGTDAHAIVGGDLNVFPRPDDPFFPWQPLHPSDQLAPLYRAGLANLYDALVQEVPSSAYSYVFEGQAQTLDQLFVTNRLRDKLQQVRAAHINADYPADYDGDGARGASDHDPVVARFDHLPTHAGGTGR
jgi:predicted extracellular nuclease